MHTENNEFITNARGCIEVITGSMFSGKTEELIRRLIRAQYANQNVKIFKPKIDNRYSQSKVVSHNNRRLKSIVVKNADEILKKTTAKANVIGIDEAQFFDNSLIETCTKLANKGIRVIVAGLDMDFRGNPFGPMPQLMAIAEYVTKLHAICVKCGNPALNSHRKTDENNLVLIGTKKEYEPLCRNCFLKRKKHGS